MKLGILMEPMVVGTWAKPPPHSASLRKEWARALEAVSSAGQRPLLPSHWVKSLHLTPPHLHLSDSI